MEKSHISLFPWLSPRVIKFVPVNGGIEVQLWKNNRVIKAWHPLQLRSVLPEPLCTWIAANHFHEGPQPYPLVKQLQQSLVSVASKKLIIDASVITALEEVSQPPDFALVWTLNYSLERIEGRYEGIDRYLGMGWFQKGSKVWHINGPLSPALEAQLKNVVVPLQQVNAWLKSGLSHLQRYLPNRVNFQLISNFTVHVRVSDVQNDKLILGLTCNYPQLLPSIKLPQQKLDLLLARQAIIQFTSQAVTPVLMHFFQCAGLPLLLQESEIPLFISEQLPAMRRYGQIWEDEATRITQAHPIVSMATLKPTFTLAHQYKDGIGSYTPTAMYQYQQHTLDMNALLAAQRQQQRFVQQYATWFEWPSNVPSLVDTLQQSLATRPLKAEEIMGFDTRRTAFAPYPPPAHTIQLDGTTPVERAQAIFEQLRLYGIPGGIVGEPKGLATMFIKACDTLLRKNQQVRILWLAPSNKRGAVTRALHGSTIGSYVTVASPVTLRDEPALFSRSWTLVIFQGLDLLLDGSPQSVMLPQLKWQWALISVLSRHVITPPAMRILHLPERYYEQFRTRYLFDPTIVSAAPAPHTIDLNRQKVSQLQEESEQLHNRLVREETSPFLAVPTRRNAPMSQPVMQLNQDAILQLREASEQLQGRLMIEEEESKSEPSSLPVIVPTTSRTQEAREIPSEIDEDWQIILQQWQPEHWEIIQLLCQDQLGQFALARGKPQRPLSRLIDEVNIPVDEQLGDLLIDPDTQTLAPHLREITQNLVHWYYSPHSR